VHNVAAFIRPILFCPRYESPIIEDNAFGPVLLDIILLLSSL